MGTGHDGSPDLSKTDALLTPVEDLAPPQPDWPNAPDLVPDLPPTLPEPGPDLRPNDPQITWDPDVRYLWERPELPIIEVNQDVPADRPTDLILDFPNRLDIALVDRPPAYDLNSAPDELPPKRDSSANPDVKEASELCTASGGTVNTLQCCKNTSDFPDSCTTTGGDGACSCSPENSRDVKYCACPSTACFLPGTGCVGPGSVCTVGMDQTCNDSSLISSIRGRCLEGGRCLCTRSALSPTSGKCL